MPRIRGPVSEQLVAIEETVMIGNFVLRTSIGESLKSKNRRTARFCVIAILMAALSTMLAHAQLTQLYAFQYDANTISNYPDGQSPLLIASCGARTMH